MLSYGKSIFFICFFIDKHYCMFTNSNPQSFDYQILVVGVTNNFLLPYCCFSDFPNSYNISISNKQKMAER